MVQFTATGNLFLFASTLALINAQGTNSYMPVYWGGPYNLSSHESNITTSLYEQAAANPNATRSIKFHPFAWFSGLNPDNYRDIEWTWRVNVSDFLATNAAPESKDGASLVNPHVVLTTYDLGWTGGGNLSEQVGRDTPVCITTAMSYTWPANVTNRYADGDTDSADCGPVLGDECRDAIISRGSSFTSGCGGTGRPWSTLPECASSFGYAHSQSQYAGLMTFNFNGANGTRPQSGINDTRLPGGVPNPTSGTGFFAFNSRPSNATNTTDYYEATNRLHVVMINANLPILNGRMSKPTLVCMRVNTTKIDEDGNSNEGGSNNEDDNNGEGGNGDEDGDSSAVRGAGLSTSIASVAGMVILVAWLL